MPGLQLLDKVPSIDIRTQTGLTDWIEAARLLKWKCAKKMMLREDRRWCTEATLWTPTAVATSRPGINRRRDTRPSCRDQDRKARHYQPREMNRRITAPSPLRYRAVTQLQVGPLRLHRQRQQLRHQ
uniref:ANK_REP_REGION domain-containing protein n=1 Tax=Steinernema glaseri TaxID=37863 RepID=A0A1I8AUA5_9BILA